MKQCDLSRTETKKYSSTEHQSATYDNCSSEDDIPLSTLSKPDDVEHPNALLPVYNQEQSVCPLSLRNSNNIEQASSIPNLNVSKMSTSTGNECHMSNFSEDDMPLSLLHKWNKDKQTKISGHIKKKKRRSRKSKASKMQKITDVNVMHMAEVIPPSSLTFTSD